jgi:hypothetical protein
MLTELVVGLSAWIIQDGNYGDFARGDTVAFAVEFYAPEKLAVSQPGDVATPSLRAVEASLHEIRGRVVHVADDWWVIDIGVGIFCEETPPADVRVGSWVRGTVNLGIDPFFYFERLVRQSNAPPLIHEWMIKKVEMQTAPFVEIRPRVMQRDPERTGWKDIHMTDAWGDDDGHADYILHCQRLPAPPRRALHRLEPAG